MATVVLTDVRVEINAVDLSDWVRSITVDYNAEGLDDTNMGDTTKINIGGLKAWGGTVLFTGDEAAGGPAATLFSLIGSTATFKGRITSGAISVTNPEYNGTALFTGFPPITGAVGQVMTNQLAFTSAGALTRSTA